MLETRTRVFGLKIKEERNSSIVTAAPPHNVVLGTLHYIKKKNSSV